MPASRRPSTATIAAPMIPASFRSSAGTTGRADGQARDELVGVLADAAAEDEQLRPHQVLDALEVLVEVLRPGLPRQPAAGPGGGRRAALGRPAADLHLAELGVRDERPVDEHARPDAGPERQEDHRAGLPAPTPKRISAMPAASASLTISTRRLQRLREPLGDREVDPGRDRCSRRSSGGRRWRRPAGRRRPARRRRSPAAFSQPPDDAGRSTRRPCPAWTGSGVGTRMPLGRASRRSSTSTTAALMPLPPTSTPIASGRVPAPVAGGSPARAPRRSSPPQK